MFNFPVQGPSPWKCGTCGRSYTNKRHLTRHQLTHKKAKTYRCTTCSKGFHRDDVRRQHEKVHRTPSTSTPLSASLRSVRIPPAARKRKPNPFRRMPEGFRIMKTNTAFKGASVTYKLSYPHGNSGDSVVENLEKSTSAMHEKLYRFQNAKKPIKFNMSLHAVFVQAKDEEITTHPPIVLVTEQHEVYMDTDIDEILSACAIQLGDRIVAFERNGSGWTIQTLLQLDSTVWKLDPLRAETYHPLPAWVGKTRCVVNVRNNDNECFRHAMMAGLYTPENNRDRMSSYQDFYQHDDAPNFSRVEYPMKIRDISKFENDNEDISINVYGIKDEAPKIQKDAELEDTDDEGEPPESISVLTSESESDDKETEEDRAFVDDEEYEDDPSFYRQVDAQLPSTEMKSLDSAESRPDTKRGFVYPIRIASEVRRRHLNLLITEQEGS